MADKGIFITFEGPEGSGKSTQAKLLSEYVSELGIDVVRTREPGGVSIAEQLREMLLNPDNMIYPRAELLLYAAGRAQHTEELIQPALNAGKCVICERYVYASVAYQGYGRGLDIDLIKELNKVATGGIAPDVTIILDIDVKEGLKRVERSDRVLDRLEQENISFHEKVRNGYLELARENPDIVVINTMDSQENILNKIISILKDKKLIKQ
jgi:dTMP kinase